MLKSLFYFNDLTKRFDVIIIYDELLPLKTPAQATSGSGVPIPSKSLNNRFAAFFVKSGHR